DEISIYYDPMIAKVIAWGDTRDAARQLLIKALGDVEVVGVTTNAAFLKDVVSHPVFASGEMDTGFIEAHTTELLPGKQAAPADVAAFAALALAQNRTLHAARGSDADPYSPWNDVGGWRLVGTAGKTLTLLDHDTRITAEVTYGADVISVSLEGAEGQVSTYRVTEGAIEAVVNGARMSAGVHIDDETVSVMKDGATWTFDVPDPLDVDAADAAALGGVEAPMTGKITQVWVQAGDSVQRGAPLIALEAMKMEHTLNAPADVTVAEVLATPGDQVEGGAALVVFDAPGE
ncbi:MAG: biotin/lipoyl-containing protein, partial [Pseudomonadota bacterium]